MSVLWYFRRLFVCVGTAAVLCFAMGETAAASNPQVNPAVQKAVAAFLHSEGTTSKDAVAVTWDCLAAISLLPSVGAPALSRIKDDANALVATSDLVGDGRVGWTYDPNAVSPQNCAGPGTLSTFHTGCNKRFTKYNFQTSLAATCLARAYEATQDGHYLDVARRAIADAEESANNPDPEHCVDCRAYSYSLSPNDHGRIVRSVNALMGMANAWLYHTTGDERYRRQAQAVANQELRELKAGNFGYLSIDDPGFKRSPDVESMHIENHAPYTAKGLYDIGRILNEPAVLDAAAQSMRSWLYCLTAACNLHKCSYWAGDADICHETVTLAPCFLKKLGETFSTACDRAASSAPSFNTYQIWAIFDPGPTKPFIQSSPPT